MFSFFKRKEEALPRGEEDAVKKLDALYTNYIRHLLPKVLSILDKCIPASDLNQKGVIREINTHIANKKDILAVQLTDQLIKAFSASEYQRYDKSQNIKRFTEVSNLAKILRDPRMNEGEKLQRFNTQFATSPEAIRGPKRIFGIRGEKVKVIQKTNSILNWYEAYKASKAKKLTK